MPAQVPENNVASGSSSTAVDACLRARGPADTVPRPPATAPDVTAGSSATARTALEQHVETTVTRLTPADAGEALTLQLAAWVVEGRRHDSFTLPPLVETVDDVRGQLADTAITAWGRRDERGRLVAMVRTWLLGPEVAFLARLGVVPDLAGHGYGSVMLRLAERRLPDQVSRIELITGVNSTGNHAFYGRHGYQAVDPTAVGADAIPGTVRMVKQRVLR